MYSLHSKMFSKKYYNIKMSYKCVFSLCSLILYLCLFIVPH